jgi:uncharacterized membrane protein YdjX (TVP38/TMEM64 family)
MDVKKTLLKRGWPLLLLLLLSLLLWTFGIGDYLSFTTLKIYHHQLRTFVIDHPFLVIILYVLTYIVVVTFSIPGATVMTITGGFLFGIVKGTIATVISATVGATFVFILARYATDEILTQKVAPWLNKLEEGFKKNAFQYLLTLRLIPLFPFFAVNLVAALLRVPLKTFTLATLIGIIPGSLIYGSLGVGLESILHQSPTISLAQMVTWQMKVALMGLAILVLLPIIYKKWLKKGE